MGDNTERTITKTSDGDWTDGETTYRVPMRTFHVVADNLAVHAGARCPASIRDSEGELTAFSLFVRGIARMGPYQFGIADHVRSMSRPAERHTDKFSLHLHAFDRDPSDKRSTTVVLGFSESNWELGDADEWYIDCGLPADMLAELVTAIRVRRVPSLRIGIHFDDLYAKGGDWPAAGVDWYLPPEKHGDDYRKETTAHGYVSAIYWQEQEEGVAPKADAGDDDASNTLPTPATAILAQLTQARVEIGKSFERINRVLIVVAVAAIAIALALLF